MPGPWAPSKGTTAIIKPDAHEEVIPSVGSGVDRSLSHLLGVVGGAAGLHSLPGSQRCRVQTLGIKQGTKPVEGFSVQRHPTLVRKAKKDLVVREPGRKSRGLGDEVARKGSLSRDLQQGRGRQCEHLGEEHPGRGQEQEPCGAQRAAGWVRGEEETGVSSEGRGLDWTRLPAPKSVSRPGRVLLTTGPLAT